MSCLYVTKFTARATVRTYASRIDVRQINKMFVYDFMQKNTLRLDVKSCFFLTNQISIDFNESMLKAA